MTNEQRLAAPARRFARDAAHNRGSAALFGRYRATRDPALRAEIVTRHLPLAASLARSFDTSRVAFDDLMQVASIGLIKAVERYDPAYGTAFSTFAVPTIRGEIQRYFRDHTWGVRPPRDLQERALALLRASDQIRAEIGRTPTAAELADRVGATVEEVLEGLYAGQARDGDPIEQPAADHDDGLPHRDSFGVEDSGYEEVDSALTADALLTKLTVAERRVLHLRFNQDLTQQAVGQLLGCSQMQVSRIQRAAMAKLAQIAEDGADDPDFATDRDSHALARVHRVVATVSPPASTASVTHDGLASGPVSRSRPLLPSSGFAVPEDLYSIGRRMNASKKKVVQYLGEAQASENALVRVLQSQIAMTPRGGYRTALEQHLRQTQEHAGRVNERRRELGQGGNPVTAVVGVVENVVGQALALGKTPFDLLRGSGGEEKVLKNAKDAYASEALEIATYTAIERLANAVGDDETARLAASIRADEEKMLERVLREIPKLTDAVVRADVKGNPSYDVTKTGAADAARDAGKAAGETARATGTRAKRTARQARKVPGVARAEGELKGAVASEGDLAIARYDTLTADEITGKLAGLSQIDLGKIDAYERKNQDRSTILSRIDALRGNEPWAGYDELTAAEVQAVMSEGDDERAQQVRAYERTHKNRAGVMQAVERELATA